MSAPELLRVGRELDTFPGATFNWLVRSVQQLKAGREFAADTPDDSVSFQALIKNEHDSTLEASFGILKVSGVLNDPGTAANEPHNGVRLKGEAPTTGEDFVVLQKSAKVDEIVPAVLSGPTWCKVDVTSSAHTHAAAETDDVEKLKSGTSGARILWKESGTGEKWAVILLGGGSSVTVQRVMVAESIDAAAWDSGRTTEGENTSIVHDGELTPSTATVWLLEESDGVFEPTEETEVEHVFTSGVSVSSGMGRVGLVINGILFNVDCEQVAFYPPEE